MRLLRWKDYPGLCRCPNEDWQRVKERDDNASESSKDFNKAGDLQKLASDSSEFHAGDSRTNTAWPMYQGWP